MATFVVEEWVEPQAGDGRFVHVKGLSFDDHREAHTELERLIAAGKLSEKAVVVLYSEPSNELEIEEVGDDWRAKDDAATEEQFFTGSDSGASYADIAR